MTFNNLTAFSKDVSAALVTLNLFGADAEQCKYGKNRVEADAKRLQAKEDELMKKKQEIRNHLTVLKKERRDLRTAVEAAAGSYPESFTDGARWHLRCKYCVHTECSLSFQANAHTPPCQSD